MVGRVIRSELKLRTDAQLANAAHCSGITASVPGVKDERDRFLDKENC